MTFFSYFRFISTALPILFVENFIYDEANITLNDLYSSMINDVKLNLTEEINRFVGRNPSDEVQGGRE